MFLRNVALSACLAAAWLSSLVSFAESAATGTARGPLCRIAAWCAASSFKVGAWWGGDDKLMLFLDENSHVRACVREAATTSWFAAEPNPDISFLAHVLFEY